MSDSDCSYVEEGEDFEERFTELKLQWKNALKKAKKLLLKCPNYERCQFKCGSVGGMQYHYVRCTGKSPKFKCDHCPRKYESRTGLNYHMASNHGTTPVEEIKSEGPGRPQRMTALSTMSAIIIANNPPPLKQVLYKIPPSKTTPKTTPTLSNRPLLSESPVHQQTIEPKVEQKLETEELEPNIELKLEVGLDGRSGNNARTKTSSENVEQPKVKIAKIVQDVPVMTAEGGGEEEDVGGEGEGKEGEGGCDKEREGEERVSKEREAGDEADGAGEGREDDGREGGGENEGTGKGRGRKRTSKDKKSSKAVNIPSIEYPDEYKYFLPSWRQEMKDNKIIKCPNYEECEFKCTTVNGMKYHYVRCMKTNPPEFNCEVCGKKFQCRTGLVWHLKKTHMLVDMHPSKEGGFQGIIEADGTPFLSYLGQVTTRKRGKLDESLKRRGSGAGRKASGSGKREWPGARLRRRSRKCNFPRRTADEILQNIVNIKILPEPKLAPESPYSNLPSCEYVVVDNIPTDVDHKASAVITLGEEALQWQQMYSNESNTDDEDDDEDDYLMEVEGLVGEGEVRERGSVDLEDEDGAFDNDFSRSSSSDSDEDYTVPYQRKRRGGKTAETRGRGRRGRGGGVGISSPHTRPPPSSLTRPKIVSHEDSSPDVKRLTSPSLPPPLISPQCPPLLIKANQDSIHLGLGGNIDQGASRGRGLSGNTHIQPPPALIMPEMGVVKSGSNLPRRQPPPLLHKQEEPIPTQHLQQQKPARIMNLHPQVLIPSPSMVGVAGESLSPGGIISVPRNIPPAPPLTPVKRRPGRPKKDQLVAVNANQPQKISHAINVSLGRGGRGGRGRAGAGVAQLGKVSPRTIRVRQFDFHSQQQQQQQQASVTVNQKVYLAQPNHTPTSSSSAGTPPQFQSLILQAPTNSSLHSSIVTPLQIVSAVQASTPPVPVQTFSTVPHGGLIYLQGTAPHQAQDHSPTFVAKGNQMYQIVTPTASAGRLGDVGDGTKKISVIMQSSTGCQATYVQRGEVGGYHYVTQLDGPQPLVSCDGGGHEDLRRRFEMVRQQVAIWQLDGPPPPAPRTRNKLSCDSSAKSHDSKLKSGDKRTEGKMSDQLESSLDREGIQQCAPACASSAKKNKRLSKGVDHVIGARTGRRGKLPSSYAAEDGEQSLPMAKRSCSRGSPVSPPQPSSGGTRTRGRDLKGRGRGRRKSEATEEAESCELSMSLGSSLAGDDVEVCVPTASSGASQDGEQAESEQCRCSQCDHVCSSMGALTTHVIGVHKTLSVEDSPEVCRSVWRQMLKRQRSVTCHLCHTHEANSIQAMRYHSSKCGKSIMLKCDKCGKVYTSKAGLSYHLSHAHAERRSFTSQAAEEEGCPRSPSSPLESPISSLSVPLRRAAARASREITKLALGDERRTGEGLARVSGEVPVVGEGGEDGVGREPEVDYAVLRKQLKEVGEFTCPREDCGRLFRTIKGVRYHLNNCHMRSKWKREESAGASESKVTVMGKDCEDGLDSLALRKQLREAGIATCPQEGCGKTFRSFSGLLYHLRNYHTRDGGKGGGVMKYQCPLCGKVLMGKKRIGNHFTAKHPDSMHYIEEKLEGMEYIPGSSLTDEDLSSNSGEEGGWEKETEERLAKEKRKSSFRSKRASLNIEDAQVYEVKFPRTYQHFCKEVRDYFEAVYDKERSLLSKEEWKPRLEDWHLVRDSSSFLPVQTHSMQFRIATEPCKESDPSFSSPSSSLLLFQALSTPANKGAVFFTGGPVWAMDWLPWAPLHHQYLALAAYRELDETHPLTSAMSCESAIQLWDLGHLKNHGRGAPSSPPLPRLSFVIAHDYGPVRCIRWYHNGFNRSESGEDSRSHDLSSENKLLGLLAVACGDGCVRLLSIPDKNHFSFSCPPEPTVVQQSHVSGVLIPVGARAADWSEFGQCLCLDWSPGNKYNRMAAGFSNGSVCVWDLDSKLFRSSWPSSPCFLSSRVMFHPVLQLSAHKHMPCRCVAWCPQDLNFLFTGGLDKMENLWDIRKPFLPVDRQDKGFPTHSIWTRLWPNCMVAYDNMRFNVANATLGVSYKFYTCQLPLLSRTITANSAPLSGLSYSTWTDRAAAVSFSGELNIVTFPTSYHTTICHRKNHKQEFLSHHHQMVFGCRLEHEEENDMEVGVSKQTGSSSCHKRVASTGRCGRPQSMKKLAETRRLVMTLHGGEVEKELYHLPVDGIPLAALTQVCWSPNEECREWLVAGTNCGLVCLLFLPTPDRKPFSAFKPSSSSKPSVASRPSP